MNHDRSDFTGIEKGENGAGFGQGNGNRPQKSSRNLRWVFFAVDALLILAIAAAVLSLLSLFTPFQLFGTDKKETRTITWVVEINDASDAMVDALTEGSTVTDYETGKTLGTVTHVETRPYITYTDAPAADGEHVAAVEHETKTIVITLTARAEYVSGEGFTVSDDRIAAGRTYRVSFAGYVGDAECVTVR